MFILDSASIMLFGHWPCAVVLEPGSALELAPKLELELVSESESQSRLKL